jgi:hypothetical protein
MVVSDCFFVFGVCLFLCLLADWRGAGKVSKGKGIEGKGWLVGCLCLFAWGRLVVCNVKFSCFAVNPQHSHSDTAEQSAAQAACDLIELTNRKLFCLFVSFILWWCFVYCCLFVFVFVEQTRVQFHHIAFVRVQGPVQFHLAISHFETDSRCLHQTMKPQLVLKFELL